MTGRTHDLAALTALNTIVVTQPLPDITFSTVLASGLACFIGSLIPDIDDPASDFWDKIPVGSVIGRLFRPLIGGHRSISHSILGIIIIGFIAKYLFNLAGNTILVDMNLVWIAFMVGLISHVLMDTFTIEGVPWFFPISIHIGFPPIKFLRIKTGGWIERIFIFPGLLAFDIYLIYNYYPVYLKLLS